MHRPQGSRQRLLGLCLELGFVPAGEPQRSHDECRTDDDEHDSDRPRDA